MRKKVLPVLLVLFAFSGFAYAFDPDGKAELEKIFSAAIESVGGERAVERIKSIEALADCVGPDGKYTTAVASFRSGKTVFKQTYSYRSRSTGVFINGDVAWERSAETGEFSIVPPFQRLVVELHEYQKMAFDFERMFSGFRFAGEEDFAARRSFKVEAEHSLGGKIFLYFDAETKLFSGYVLPVPGSDESVKNVVNQWKTVGGVKLPSQVTATDQRGDWILRFHTVEINKANEKLLEVPPRVADLDQLLKLHEQAKRAHLTYDAELFIELFADNVTELQNGNVRTRSRVENLERFKNYFSSYKFIEWEDIKPPVIKISGDGTLATVRVEKRVRGTYKNDKGKEESDHTVFAWLEVWEKIGGKWKITSVASTARDGKD